MGCQVTFLQSEGMAKHFQHQGRVASLFTLTLLLFTCFSKLHLPTSEVCYFAEKNILVNKNKRGKVKIEIQGFVLRIINVDILNLAY